MLEKLKKLFFKEEMKEQKSIVDRLPREIFLEILSFLEPKELVAIAKVSRKWKNLSESDMLWKRFVEQESIVKFLSQKQNYSVQQRINKLKNTVTEIDPKIFTMPPVPLISSPLPKIDLPKIELPEKLFVEDVEVLNQDFKDNFLHKDISKFFSVANNQNVIIAKWKDDYKDEEDEDKNITQSKNN